MADERIHREDPERTGPQRSWNEGADGANSGPAGDWQKTIENSVRLGYELIDSQIREGRKMAEQFGGSFLGGDVTPGADGMRSAADTMARTFTDMTSRWFEVMTGAMSGTPGTNGWPDFGRGGDSSSETKPLTVEIASSSRVRLTLEFELTGYPLDASDLCM
jgi:hypothetical protein